MIANGLVKYEELLDEQGIIFDYEEDYKILGSALKKLPECHLYCYTKRLLSASLQSSRPV